MLATQLHFIFFRKGKYGSAITNGECCLIQKVPYKGTVRINLGGEKIPLDIILHALFKNKKSKLFQMIKTRRPALRTCNKSNCITPSHFKMRKGVEYLKNELPKLKVEPSITIDQLFKKFEALAKGKKFSLVMKTVKN